MRSMSEWRCLRLRVRGREDCVISAEDLDVLQAWMRRLGLPYYGQLLAGAASEVFLHLLKARRDPPGSRQALLGAGPSGSARPPSPQPRASWTTSFPCTSPLPRRPSHATTLEGLRAVRGIAPTPAARLQAQQPQAGPHLPRNRLNRRGPVPQERPGPCQVPGAHLLPQRQRGASPRSAPGGRRQLPYVGQGSLRWPTCDLATSCTAWTPRRTWTRSP